MCLTRARGGAGNSSGVPVLLLPRLLSRGHSYGVRTQLWAPPHMSQTSNPTHPLAVGGLFKFPDFTIRRASC